MRSEKIPFSPPDITEREILEVSDTLRSGWITTGPKTARFEKMIGEYCLADRVVCFFQPPRDLNSPCGSSI